MSFVVSMLESKVLVQPPIIMHSSDNQDAEFKAFEILSHDSKTRVTTFSQEGQTQSGTSKDSSVSRQTTDETREYSSSSMHPDKDLYDHPDLVKVYGCGIEGNQLLLVYEYLENNSLARALFAKLDEEENTHISTRIAGTICYMAPEYAMRGYLTNKADVYSFGVVTLENVSGKSNTNHRSNVEFVYLLELVI
ncbi:hypothetical protein Q3G72_021954 [Acer saccharum]|nr:hypothetical protein Q3G72_021954 [Acer saccharum]